MKIIAVFFLLLTTSLAASETIKIGYIDPEKVINNLPQYNQSIDQISREFEPKKQELLDLFEHIELLRTKVNDINKSVKKENLEEELFKLAKLEKSFEQETEFWQDKMNKRKIDLLQKIE